MWVQRTSEEEKKWHEMAIQEARSHGKLIGWCVWILVSIMVAGGWFGLSAGFIAHRNVNGSFWVRFPIFAVLAAPFAYWVAGRESKKELEKIKRRTICPSCDIAGHGNAGTECQCGGKLVPQSTMKWIEN